jgi:hypothetical protein
VSDRPVLDIYRYNTKAAGAEKVKVFHILKVR